MSAAELDAFIQASSEKALLKWHARWGDLPWTYALVASLRKLPFILLVALIVRWEKLRALLADPLTYLANRWIFFLTGFLLLVLYNHFVWRKKAFSYFLYARNGVEGFAVHSDSRIARMGERSVIALEKKFLRWKGHKPLLVTLSALALPALFFTLFYLASGLRHDTWTLRGFLDGFEDGVAVLLAVVFILAGLVIGNGIWQELHTNYSLMKKAYPHRER